MSTILGRSFFNAALSLGSLIEVGQLSEAQKGWWRRVTRNDSSGRAFLQQTAPPLCARALRESVPLLLPFGLSAPLACVL